MDAIHEGSVEDLARTQFRRVYGFCRSLLGGDAEAEDAAQNVFLTVWRRRSELGGIRNPVPWLLQIARLTCLNARRDRDRRRAEPVESDSLPDAGSPIPASEDADRVRAARERLPERYRTVLLLHFQQGLGHEEMARVMGLSRGALRVLLHRAVVRLREETRKS
jgi:RNA polymerase sigma-70 factor (ECF subfamily)